MKRKGSGRLAVDARDVESMWQQEVKLKEEEEGDGELWEELRQWSFQVNADSGRGRFMVFEVEAACNVVVEDLAMLMGKAFVGVKVFLRIRK